MSKILNVGIIGAGNIAGKVSKAFHFVESTNMYAIASRTQKKADDFAEQYNVEKAYGTYEQLLNDPMVDLVYIATPHSEHFRWAMKCIEHGKPVLCEKAFTMNALEAKELLTAAEAKNIYVGEAIWTRYLPYVAPLKKALEDGIIGDITTIHATFGFKAAPKGRLTNPMLAGGALLDLGIYPLTHASLIMGDEFNFIDSTAVMLDTGVDGQHSITITYPNKKMAVLHCSLMNRLDNNITIYGTEGKVLLTDPSKPEGYSVTNYASGEVSVYEYPCDCNGYEYEIQRTAQNILDGKLECPIFPHNKIIFMMETMDTIRQQWGLEYPTELKH